MPLLGVGGGGCTRWRIGRGCRCWLLLLGAIAGDGGVGVHVGGLDVVPLLAAIAEKTQRENTENTDRKHTDRKPHRENTQRKHTDTHTHTEKHTILPQYRNHRQSQAIQKLPFQHSFDTIVRQRPPRNVHFTTVLNQ